MDPFDFVKEQVKEIKLFVDLAATAQGCKYMLKWYFRKKTTFSVNEREKIELHLRSIKNLVDLVQDRFYEICITYFSSLKLRKERVQNSRH